MRWTRTTTPTTTPTRAPALSEPVVAGVCLVPVGLLSPGGPKGPGFGGSGIAEGTLQYVSEDGQAAGAVVSNFSVTYLNEPALEILAHVPTDGAPHTVHLKELGTFRVTSQVVDDKTVLVGVQMDSIDDVVLMLVAVEVGLSLVVALPPGSPVGRGCAASCARSAWFVRQPLTSRDATWPTTPRSSPASARRLPPAPLRSRTSRGP